MKKFFMFFVPAVALLLGTSFVKANNFGSDINVINNSVVKVVANGSTEKQTISISDEYGVVLYEYDNLKSGDFKNLDFANAPDGSYFIKVEDNKAIQTTQLDKQDGVVTISNKPDVFVKPVFKRNGNKLNVYFMNPNKDDVQIEIYDEYNVLVNSFKNSDAVFEKSLDFSKSLHGNYKVVLAQNNNVYTTNFDY